MESNQQKPQPQQKPPVERPQSKLDIPHLIKWIILVILVILVIAEYRAGEYDRFPKMEGLSWLILFIKLLLIAIIIWLMRLQRSLKCQVTDPSACVTPEYDLAHDKSVIVVKGTAGGAVFQYYELVLKEGAISLPVTVFYPGGGAAGTTPVTAGELGRIDVSGLEPAVSYKVEMTVHATTGATKVCTGSEFTMQRKIAFIDAIGAVPAQFVGLHPDDATEYLKLVNYASLPLPDPLPAVDPVEADVAIGGSVSVEGSADTYGCGRQMVQYALQYQEVASGNNAAQADAPAGWSAINPPLPFGLLDPDHPRWYSYLFGTFPNFVLNGELTRVWKTVQKIVSISPVTYADRRVTVKNHWSTLSLNGRFTVRVMMTDDNIIGPSVPAQSYDAATVWIDNRQIEARITGLSVSGGASLELCEELSLSQFISGGTKVNMLVEGTAWDPLILNSYPHTLTPNDNFDLYNLHFKKDGSVVYSNIVTGVTSSVPTEKNESFAALASQTGTLASWDIVAALDGGPKPSPASPPLPASDPKIYRGDRCAYVLKLYVRDTTRLSDTGDIHDREFEWPFCIINDLDEVSGLGYPIP